MKKIFFLICGVSSYAFLQAQTTTRPTSHVTRPYVDTSYYIQVVLSLNPHIAVGKVF